MMRTAAAAAAWFVAVVAAAVTVPTLWVATHVADEDGYVRFTRSFVQDAELRGALADQVADDLGSAAGLPAPARKAVAAAMATLTGQLADEPGFAKAWEESQRRTHRLTFDDDADRLTIDVGPIASYVVEQAGSKLPVRIEVPSRLPVPIYDVSDRRVLDQVSETPGRARVGLVLVAAGAALCLLLARRRSVALAALGVGALLVAGVLRLATGWAVPSVLDRTPARSPFARQMRDLLVDRATDSLNGWLVILAIGGAVVTLLGLVLRGRP